MKLVRFECGCIGFVLEESQRFERRNSQPANAIVLQRCDGDYDQPDHGFWGRQMELDQIDGAKALTAEEVKELSETLDRLISMGHTLGQVRRLLREPKER